MTDLETHLLAFCGFCPHCLNIKNAAISPAAIVRKGEYLYMEGPATNVRALIRWLQDMIGESAGNVRFLLGDCNDMFIPVAIMNATPVCAWHLKTLIYR